MAEPRPYPQLLRTADFRRWRPAVSIGVGVLVLGAVLIGPGVLLYGAVELAGGDPDAALDDTGPWSFLVINLSLAAGIPVSMLAVAVAFHREPGWLASVQHRYRWGWLLRCLGVCLVWGLLLSGVWFALDGVPGSGGEDVALLIAVCLLTTPLQAAGEEYVFRGWLTQAIGSWFARPVAGAVVAGLVTATVFALVHGQQDPWLFADRWFFGVLASWLVWRTGGLEAAIMLHAVVNIVSIIPAVVAGTLDDSLTLTSAPAPAVVLDLVALTLAALVLAWLARRTGVVRRAQTPGPERATDLGAVPAAR